MMIDEIPLTIELCRFRFQILNLFLFFLKRTLNMTSKKNHIFIDIEICFIYTYNFVSQIFSIYTNMPTILIAFFK